MEPAHCSKELQSIIRLELGCRNALCPGVENPIWFTYQTRSLSCLVLNDWTDFRILRFEITMRRWLASYPQFVCLMSLRTGTLESMKDDIHGFTVIALVIASVQAVGALHRFIFLLLIGYPQPAAWKIHCYHLVWPFWIASSFRFLFGWVFEMIQRSWTGTRQQESGLYIFSLSHRHQRKSFSHHFILSTGLPMDFIYGLGITDILLTDIIIVWLQVQSFSGFQPGMEYVPWISNSILHPEGQDLIGRHYSRECVDPEHRSVYSASWYTCTWISTPPQGDPKTLASTSAANSLDIIPAPCNQV